MAEVLSQTEIDALLAAVSNGKVDTTERAKPATDWIAYDLTSQERFISGRLPALQGIHERFASLFRLSLTGVLKKGVAVRLVGTEFLRLGDYLQRLSPPTSLNLYSIPRLKGNLIFVVGHKIAYSLLDAYYGGAERPYSSLTAKEGFTQIESNMIRKICALATKDLSEAWKMNYPLELEYSRSETNPQFVGVMHASEVVVVATFEIELENLSGPVNVVIQRRALDPIQSFLSDAALGDNGDASTWKAHWAREIHQTSLELSVELGHARQTLSQIKEWKAGDTVPLNQGAVTALTVFLEGIPKLKGLMGSYRGNQAARITEILKK